MSSRWARVARGALVAAFSIFAAMFSHVVVGGSAPGGIGVALAATFGVLVSMIAVGGRTGLVRLSVSVVASQFALHAMFSVGAPTETTFHQASHHGALIVSSGATASAHSVYLGHSGASMWLAHALAAAITIAFLRRGERALWSVLATASERLLAVLIGTAATQPVPCPTTRLTPTVAELRTVRDNLRVALSSLQHRGPPANAVRALSPTRLPRSLPAALTASLAA